METYQPNTTLIVDALNCVLTNGQAIPEPPWQPTVFQGFRFRKTLGAYLPGNNSNHHAVTNNNESLRESSLPFYAQNVCHHLQKIGWLVGSLSLSPFLQHHQFMSLL